MGFELGLGNAKTFIFFSFNHFVVSFAVRFGSLSCWKKNLLHVDNPDKCSTPCCRKHSHNRILLLPCVTVKMVPLGWWAVFDFRQTYCSVLRLYNWFSLIWPLHLFPKCSRCVLARHSCDYMWPFLSNHLPIQVPFVENIWYCCRIHPMITLCYKILQWLQSWWKPLGGLLWLFHLVWSNILFARGLVLYIFIVPIQNFIPKIFWD